MSYFDTTVFNRIAQQQKETKDLLRELIKTLQEQKSKCRYPTQNFEPPTAPAAPQAGEMEVFGLQWPGEDRINLSTVFDTETEALGYMQNRCDTPGIRLVRFSSNAPTTQAADSVPAVEHEQERIAFKDAHRHLDLDEVPDAWGRPMFKHSHVEVSWLGWIARASHGQALASKIEGLTAAQESLGVEFDKVLHDNLFDLYEESPQTASHGQAPAGDWLWVKLMDFCKKRRFAPANFNDLFEIVDAARAARAPADSVLEDAACWHWLAEYLVGTRTDLDDEIVASETVNDLRKLVEAAMNKGATQ